MLEAKSDRLDYGEQLIPPDPDYELDYAVGTTYSLDLEAIMVLPVALFHSRHLDIPAEDVPFDVLDSITRAAERIRVYCQLGKLKVPKKYNQLMAYWEKGIVQVRMPSAFISFHPKVWVVRFRKGTRKVCYRILITSRNLTYTHDWDIAFASDGEPGAGVQAMNRPLVHFLAEVQKLGGKPYPPSFLEDLARVAFQAPDGFDLFGFFPTGIQDPISRKPYANPITMRIWDELLVISPFLDATTLKFLAGRSGNNLTILSRKEELDGLEPGNLAGIRENRLFQFQEGLRDAEYIEGVCDCSRMEPRAQDLHAKTFIGTSGPDCHWFLGSANCTQPAFANRNIEFMVGLESKDPKGTPARVRRALTQAPQGETPLFEPYRAERQPDVADEDLAGKLRKVIYDLSGLVFSGRTTPRPAAEETLYDLVISCDATGISVAEGFGVQVRPLPETNLGPRSLVLGAANRLEDFGNYSERQLSPFLEIQVHYRGKLVKAFVAEMEIELPGTRLDAIFKSLINNQEKFVRYLSFLLGHGNGEDQIGLGRHSTGEISQRGSWRSGSLFEDLLMAASRRPERMRDVERLVQRYQKKGSQGTTVLADDFLRLWAVFQDHLRRRAK